MKKICIIKLGADGDVIRTLPLAKALKVKYKNAQITWITKGDVATLLEGNPYIEYILKLPYRGPDAFDELYNFDIDKEATSLAKQIKADKKYGFYEDAGYPVAFNKGAEYYLNTIFDDELKKSNKKTYQEMMFMAAELTYKKELCPIILKRENLDYAAQFIKENNINIKNLIGIHIGASSRWPSKVWHSDKVKEFIRKAKNKGFNIILFGGPNEISSHSLLVKELENEGIKIYRNAPENTKGQFASLVNLCNAMICGDSLSLHVSLALKKKTIALFFCTSPDEVEGYGLLKKIVSPKLNEFFPEKSDIYDEGLVKSINEDDVLMAFNELVA